MTWKEFKEYVEARGMKDNDVVLYLDTYPGPDTKIIVDERGRKSVVS
jgi:hypothetical protein